MDTVVEVHSTTHTVPILSTTAPLPAWFVGCGEYHTDLSGTKAMMLPLYYSCGKCFAPSSTYLPTSVS